MGVEYNKELAQKIREVKERDNLSNNQLARNSKKLFNQKLSARQIRYILYEYGNSRVAELNLLRQRDFKQRNSPLLIPNRNNGLPTFVR